MSQDARPLLGKLCLSKSVPCGSEPLKCLLTAPALPTPRSCFNIMRYCTGSLQQYANITDCMEFWRDLRSQTCVKYVLRGNSTQCRWTHLQARRPEKPTENIRQRFKEPRSFCCHDLQDRRNASSSLHAVTRMCSGCVATGALLLGTIRSRSGAVRGSVASLLRKVAARCREALTRLTSTSSITPRDYPGV